MQSVVECEHADQLLDRRQIMREEATPNRDVHVDPSRRPSNWSSSAQCKLISLRYSALMVS